MTQLAPCPHCKRHLRITESVCPFCESSVAGKLTPKQSRPLHTRGLSRAGILALGASLAAAGALEGCVDELEPEPKDDGRVVPVYGAPVQTDDGGPIAVPLYGAPIQPDAGKPDAGQADAGRLVPVYGAPIPLYGAPIQPPIDSSED